MSTPLMKSFRTDLFSPDNITSVEDVRNALFELQSIFTEQNYEHVLDELLQTPFLVELVLSDLSTLSVKAWLLEKFPTSPPSYISSVTCQLLLKLATFFVFPPISFSQEVLDLMREFHTTVRHAPAALHDLFAMSFLDEGQHEEAKELSISSKGKSKSRWRSKDGEKAAIRQIIVDPEPFAALALTIPNTSQERDHTTSHLLVRLKTILEIYLETISLPAISQHLKEALIPKEQLPALTTVIDLAASRDVSISAKIAITDSAYLQSLKTARYFDSVVGFGEWLVYISTAADSHLRQFRRKDKKIFEIIVKKIRELSNGRFSDDNQKRLSGPTTQVPIFEAKMVRDLRLVYQIDCVCVPSSSEETEQQVLKIWGIFTHAQLNKHPWDSLSRLLNNKGKTYQSRCKYRRRPHVAGDNVYSPASWPLSEDAEATHDVSVPDLPPDELSQVHSTFVLEKFITFSKELLFSMLADLDVSFPFEVSPRERAVIEYPFSCYVLGRSGTGKTTTMLFKMLWVERAYQSSTEGAIKPRQVFVTKSRLLATKVGDYFEKLSNSLATGSCSPQELKLLAKSRKIQIQPQRHLVAWNDIPDWRSDLPSKYSDLEDRHFPLFITFDQLCSMLETSQIEQYNNDGRKVLRSRERITYQRFKSEYWSHFPQSLTKGLDSALVFNEIMGVICGSEETVSTDRGFMDRTSYEHLSSRTQPTFAQRRTTIYDIFLHYRRKKVILGDYDAAERTHTIIAGLSQYGVPGRKLDRLYVDEAQDNLLVDALLLRLLCRNPNGLFWAGDTAQAISIGSSFRINDLKAFLFRVEKQRESSSESQHLIQEPPRTFQLSVNYRSHGGIVNCAHSLIDLISQFWPYSIDILSPERGIVDGAKPTFFSSGIINTPRHRSFQETIEAEIELGAHQCVLVRDEVARERLRSQVGSIGIILTLYESKGLEFNDVVLYNFFHDSNLDVLQWRVILNAVDVSVPVPDFDEMRHAPICSELKFLYVAITRARNNLWIVDSSSKADPMKVFWTCRDLVNDSVSEFRFTDLAVESTPEDWEIRAKDFFDQEQFAQARYAYKKALLHHAADVANAYELREIARSCSTGPPRAVFEHRMKAFANASRAFLSCAKEAIHAPEDYYRAAAGCFENAGDSPHGALTYLPEAARAYLLAKCFTNAAQLFRKAGMFDEAIDVITKHPEKVEKSVVKQIKEAARLKYFTMKEFEKAHKLFDSIEEELEYLSERNFYEAQVELLVSLGRVADAAELHLLEGHIIEALELFLEDKGDPSRYTQRVIHCILQGLWREFSLGNKESSTDVVVKLFRYADSIDPSLLSPNEHDEMELFKAISSRTFKNLVSLADAFFERQNMSAALLSLDYHFSEPQAWQNMDLVSLTATLRPFSLYVQQLHDMAFYADPRTNGHVWKMFGLRPHGHAAFVVPHGTFLHKKATSATASTMEGSRDAIVLIKKLLRIVRNALSERLLEQVTSQNEMCRRAKALFPCPLHVLGNCVKSDQCTEDHIEPNHVWYNTWIQAHIYQVLIYQTINRNGINYSSALRNSQRAFWIGKLYDALLNPPAYKFGTISSLKQELSGGFEAGFQIIIAWIRELADNLEFSSHMETQLLTQVMQTTDLSLTLNGKEAQFYLYRSKLIPPQYLRKPKDYNSLLDFLSSYKNSKPWSVLVGTLFIKQIVQNRLPVEIGVLCTYIEHLCTLAIVANRVQGTGGLHDVTLPCSWLSKALANFSLGEAAEKTIKICLFPPILGDLIKNIYTGIGSEHLLFGPELRPLTKEELPIRNMFIARLYRVLVLLGYNIRVMAFRSQIWRVSNAMHGFGQPPFSPLYERYVGARDWWEISSAVRESMQGSALDEMVNLQHAARIALPIQEHRGLRRIVYSVVEDIPALLQSGLDVPSSISESQELTSDVVSEPLNEGSKDDIADPVDKDVHEDPIEHDADPLNLGYKLPSSILNSREHTLDVVSEPLNEGREDDITDPIDDFHEGPTEYETDHSIVIEDISQQVEELHAACILQRAFRRCLARQKEREEDRLSGRCRHFFAICLDVVKKDKWGRSRYKFYFLGPLPHVLACLDAAQVAVLAKKGETKKLLRGGDIKNEAWDDLNSQLTLIVNAHKGVKQMLKSLEPTAEVHRRHDLTSLKVHISQAVNLLRTFPFKGSEDPQLYLDIAYKSVREPVRKSAKKEKKPQLNLDDEDLMHLDYA